MKKLIAISVVFALVAGAVFAVDLSAEVTGNVQLFEYNNEDALGKARIAYWMNALKLQGSAEVMDGKFGAQLRLDKANSFQGFAWWKPIDQFKLIVGQSGADDGFWGKDGCSAWGFNQKANDGIAVAAGLWDEVYGMDYREGAWYGGFNKPAVFMEIKPLDMLGINIGIPADWQNWDKNIVKKIHFQVDMNFSFGNIAITYGGNNIYLYYGGSFGAIGLDVGISVPELIDNPGFTHLYFGADLKYSAGAFGIKFRTMEGIPVKSGAAFMVNTGVLPYFAINDNMTVFFFAEMGMAIGRGISVPGFGTIGGGLTKLGWLVNPYLRIGAEWGPSFYVGLKVHQVNVKALAGSADKALQFALPIGITVSF